MSERTKRLFGQAEDTMAERMREMHERGELRHLHGRPLRLEEEDDPAWLVTRMLKQEGFSHPLLEQRNEVEAQIRAADELLARLRERRDWLSNPHTKARREQAAGFNERRRLALEDYRDRLKELNRAIRDYNITVPTSLHLTPIQIERQMERVDALVPPLTLDSFPEASRPSSVWSRLLHGRSG